MTAILFLAGLTLAVSFLCSILEGALYSVTPAQLAVLEEHGTFGARRFARFRLAIDEPIAAILTVNTIAHTVGSLWCGALAQATWDDFYVGVFTAAFTFAVLAFSEIVPKSLGVRYGLQLVPVLTWPLQVLVWISWPVALSCRALMRKISGEQQIQPPTEDEIIAMSKLAQEEGQLTASEQRWLENALRLDQVSAKDLHTPRTVVKVLDAEETLGDLRNKHAEIVHSRFPVVEGGDSDKICGVVYRREIFDGIAADRFGTSIRDLMRPIDFVATTTKGPQLLEKFILGKRHMVAVLDEFGGFDGIVTLEDVLECLLGAEIVDEHDEVEDMQELAREKARAQGVPVENGEDSAGDDAQSG